jgi:hypothetical protein
VPDRDRFLAEYRELYQEAERAGVFVAIGGRALVASLRSAMPYTCYGDGLRHLAAFARSQHGTSGRPRRGRPLRKPWWGADLLFHRFVDDLEGQHAPPDYVAAGCDGCWWPTAAAIIEINVPCFPTPGRRSDAPSIGPIRFSTLAVLDGNETNPARGDELDVDAGQVRRKAIHPALLAPDGTT